MILVCGGAGYIGSHLVKILKESKKEVLVFDNFETGHEWAVKGIKTFIGDLRELKDIQRVFEENSIDEVYHFAAYSLVGVSMQKPYEYFDNNIKGTLNLLKAMTEHNVRNIVFSSTAAVYGDPKMLPITEEQEKIPTNVYGQSKLMIEQIMNWYSKLGMINYAALRYFNAAGASLDAQIGEDHTPETHLIPLILQTVLGKREKITVFGKDYPTPDGSAVRDYVHVLDLADAHIKAMQWIKENNCSDVFNLGNGEGFSVIQVIQKTQEVTGCTVKYETGVRRSGDPAILIASSEKARTVLRWAPKYSKIEDIIQTAYNWHKK